MKLKQEFVVTNVATETVLVPTGSASFHGVVRGNKTLAAILDLLKEDTTEDAVAAAMCERFDAPEENIRRDVSRAIRELRGIGALEE
ncbi:MAG: PqqD family protein [Atopobiaceae bacterium]|nr:PqqD family protein [Atopobiaceae bacterium]